MTNTTNTYGDEIPTVYTIAHGYAWYVDTDGYLGCAPAWNDAHATVTGHVADWDNMGEPCDMTEMTNADMDTIVARLGLTEWPKMCTMPGDFTRP